MGFQSSNPTGQIGPSSLIIGGQTSQEATKKRQIAAAHAAFARSWNLPHPPPAANPSADPWKLNDLSQELAPMDLRQHPTIHFIQIRHKTKGVHYPVKLILHSGSEITMADARIINGLTKMNRGHQPSPSQNIRSSPRYAETIRSNSVHRTQLGSGPVSRAYIR